MATQVLPHSETTSLLPHREATQRPHPSAANGNSGSDKLGNEPVGRVLIPAALLVSLIFIGLTALALFHARQDVRRDAANASQNLVAMMERAFDRNLQLYDTSLRGVAESSRQPGVWQATPAGRRHVLFDSVATAGAQGAILVRDATGAVIADSRTDRIDPGSYTWLPGLDDLTPAHPPGLQIGRPYHALKNGRAGVVLSRVITDANGAFAGHVVGLFDLGFFETAATDMRLGRAAETMLLRADGTVVLREGSDAGAATAAFADTQVLQHFPAERGASFEAYTSTGAPSRLVTYTQVGSLPLLIAVALPLSDVYAGWTRWVWVIGAIVVALSVVLILGAVSLRHALVQRQLAERSARHSKARFRELTETAIDTILRVRLDGTLRYVSPSIETMLGYLPDDLSGVAGQSLINPRDVTSVQRAIGRLKGGAEQATVTYRCKHKNGSEVWVESLFRLIRDPVTGKPLEAIASCRDVTGRMKVEADLMRSAATDGLTGLANRRRFDEALASEWRRAHREQNFLALLMLDADCFKAFNDTYGHPEGDAALRMIAHSITTTIRRPGDLGARYGGEEFAVLMPNTDEAGAQLIAERIRAAIEAADMRHTGSPSGRVTASLGVAASLVFDGDDAASLLQAADRALYRAKALGRNRVVAESQMAGPSAADAQRQNGASQPVGMS